MEAAFSGATARCPSRQAGAPSIKTISERLRKELPGLRSFSETSFKNMRQFYEQWDPVISNSTAVAAELQRIKSTITVDEIDTMSLLPVKSSAMVDDLELFLNLSFSHHIIILNGEKDAGKRWKYIWLAIENKWNKRFLMEQIKENVADHYCMMPSNFGETIKDSRDAIKALSMFKDEYLLDFINTEEIGIRDYPLTTSSPTFSSSTAS